MDKKIKKNKVMCKNCGDIIESVHRHDFKWCKCGNIFVDGGKAYLKRGFKNSLDDFVELAEYEEEDFIKIKFKVDDSKSQ